MIDLFWFCCGIGLLGLAVQSTFKTTNSIPCLKSKRQWVYIFSLCWLAVLILHLYVYYNVDLQYDGIAHLREAYVLAETIESGHWEGGVGSLFGNQGYRLYLAILVGILQAPPIFPQLLNGVLGFLGLLTILETVCLITKPERIPFWLIPLTMFVPSAMLWLPLNLKEGMVVFGISSLVHLYVTSFSTEGESGWRIRDLLGVAAFFFLRPHVFMIWVFALSTSAIFAGGSLARSTMLLILMVPASLGAFIGLQAINPQLFAEMEQTGVSESLDEFHDQRSEIGNTASSQSSSMHPVVNGFITTFFSSVLVSRTGAIWALFALEAIFLSGMLFWGGLQPRVIKAVRRYSLVFGLLLVIVGMSIFLGYMYNVGLAVRQRLQVMPALLLLAGIVTAVRYRSDE